MQRNAPLKVAVTGASGFVGVAACTAFAEAGHSVRAIVRAREAPPELAGLTVLTGCDLEEPANVDRAMEGADVVVHLAARAHVMHDDPREAEALYQRANVHVMDGLAHAARRQGVRRFVFVSSIKVNGERTEGRPFKADDPPRPEDAYGRSKREAEAILRAVAGGEMDYAIVRPPLLYGPRMRGNMLRLFKLVSQGVPLPLASIRNARDLLYVGSLAQLLEVLLTHPAASGRTFLARDGAAMSTPELLGIIARALSTSARLLPCPPLLIARAGRAFGFGDAVARLVANLEVDDSETRRVLGWSPAFSAEAAFAATAAWYREQARSS